MVCILSCKVMMDSLTHKNGGWSSKTVESVT